MRYVAKFHSTKRLWFVFDTVKQSWGAYGYESRHNANKRVDKQNGDIIKREKNKDYGMRRGGPAPAPRAYKDD